MDNEFFENLDKKDFITYAKEAIGQTPLEIKLKKLDKNAIIPEYAHDGDVGMDLTAISVEYDREHDMYIYHTGLAFETDKHYGIFLFPRSSNRKTDAYLCNHVGIADSAIYRGEIILCFKNRTSLEVRAEIEKNRCFISRLSYEPFTTSGGDSIVFNWPNIARDAENEGNWIYNNPMQYAPYKVGERVAQMVVLPYPNIKISEREELSETERGSSGFGSTGS